MNALQAKLWHVTVTVGGDPMEASLVRAALERLSGEQPFLLSGRYANDRAEVRYWEEAPECADAAALALRLVGRASVDSRLARVARAGHRGRRSTGLPTSWR